MKGLNFFITIVRSRESGEFMKFFTKLGHHMIYTVSCHGTAPFTALSMLGIEETEKTMFVSLLTCEQTKATLRQLNAKMRLEAPGRGVCLAVPADSISGRRALFCSTGKTELNKREECELTSEHQLIIAITNAGHTDMVMSVARKAGAGGGTVIKGKGTRPKDNASFFGLSIADEKELIFIVTQKEKRKDIMRAIMSEAGLDSEANTVAFSLPVTSAQGFRFAAAEAPEPEEEKAFEEDVQGDN